MKRLKKRERADTHVSEARAPRRRRWDKIAYFCLVSAFFVAIGNYVAGDRLFLRADGLVVRERIELGANDLVQITAIDVQPGQEVKRGDRLLRAESLETVRRLAELHMRSAELAERSARLRSDLSVARALLPPTLQRLRELRAQIDRLGELEANGLVRAARREALATSAFDAEMQVATLKARISGLSSQIYALAERRDSAKAAVTDLETRYKDGARHAAVSGTIADAVPAVGEVMSPGEGILTLYWGQPYVLAYLPQQYLFEVRAGQEVRVRAGAVVVDGVIEAILPVSTSVPDVFRNAFELSETRQIARIALKGDAKLSTQSTVSVTRGWSDYLSETSERAARLIGADLSRLERESHRLAQHIVSSMNALTE